MILMLIKLTEIQVILEKMTDQMIAIVNVIVIVRVMMEDLVLWDLVGCVQPLVLDPVFVR